MQGCGAEFWKSARGRCSAQLPLCKFASEHLVVSSGRWSARLVVLDAGQDGTRPEAPRPSSDSLSLFSHNELKKVVAAASRPPSESHTDLSFAHSHTRKRVLGNFTLI